MTTYLIGVVNCDLWVGIEYDKARHSVGVMNPIHSLQEERCHKFEHNVVNPEQCNVFRVVNHEQLLRTE